MAIKAIETVYKGYRFRSRLEARWAVFFDALGIQWEYEPEGFEISNWWRGEEGGKPWFYLPDFRLPALGTWVEVKGSLDGVTDDYLDMIAWAIDWGGQLPGVGDSAGSTRGLLWLGPIPALDICRLGPPTHLVLQHSKGGYINPFNFLDYGKAECGGWDSDFQIEEYFDSSRGDAPAIIRAALQKVVYAGEPITRFSQMTPDLLKAYAFARSARFEHGETPYF